MHNTCPKRTSPGNMKKQVEKGQAPSNVDKVHPAHEPNAPNQHPHVHFIDGTSLNWDGSLHDKNHGIPTLTRDVIKWLKKNNWETIIK